MRYKKKVQKVKLISSSEISFSLLEFSISYNQLRTAMLRKFYFADRSQPNTQKMFLIKSEVMHELKCKNPKKSIYGYF